MFGGLRGGIVRVVVMKASGTLGTRPESFGWNVGGGGLHT